MFFMNTIYNIIDYCNHIYTSITVVKTMQRKTLWVRFLFTHRVADEDSLFNGFCETVTLANIPVASGAQFCSCMHNDQTSDFTSCDLKSLVPACPVSKISATGMDG